MNCCITRAKVENRYWWIVVAGGFIVTELLANVFEVVSRGTANTPAEKQLGLIAIIGTSISTGIGNGVGGYIGWKVGEAKNRSMSPEYTKLTEYRRSKDML